MDMSNVIPFKPEAKPDRRGGNGHGPEHMLRMQARRAEMIASGELLPNGRRPKGNQRLKPLTPQEIRDRALQTAADLFADARTQAVEKLAEQISHKDPGIAQKAAIKVLEYTDGKPNQPVTARTDNVQRVVYETAALAPAAFVPFALDDDDAAEA